MDGGNKIKIKHTDEQCEVMRKNKTYRNRDAKVTNKIVEFTGYDKIGILSEGI